MCVYDERMFAPKHLSDQEKYNVSQNLATKNGNEPDRYSDKAEEDYFKIMKNMNNGKEKTPQKKSPNGNYQGKVKFFMAQNK